VETGGGVFYCDRCGRKISRRDREHKDSTWHVTAIEAVCRIGDVEYEGQLSFGVYDPRRWGDFCAACNEVILGNMITGVELVSEDLLTALRLYHPYVQRLLESAVYDTAISMDDEELKNLEGVYNKVGALLKRIQRRQKRGEEKDG